MADLTHQDLTLHAVEDQESGFLQFVVDYDGMLIPVASVKLGLLDSFRAGAENNVHPGISGTVQAPSTANTSEGDTGGNTPPTQEQ